jgi:hypothetical protein
MSEGEATGAGDDGGERPARYLYCLVDATAGDPDAFDAAGIDDRPVRVLPVEGVGAVVHDCDGLYDSDDPLQVREWLLAHQSVVDAATEAFATPLPVRFDTVFEGGDAGVREWVRGVAGEVTETLDRFAGRREYRIGVRWHADGFAERMAERDDRLAEIAAERDAADGGGAFLREKQYHKRLDELRRQRYETLQADLLDRVEDVVETWTEQEGGGAADALADDGSDAGDGADDGRSTADDADGAGTDDTESVTRIAVLAEQAAEERLGQRLDEYVDAHDVEVRFTGPWPPYTFAPELGSQR